MMERRENIVVKKTELFADRIVKMCKYLAKKKSGDSDMLDNEEIIKLLTSITGTVKRS